MLRAMFGEPPREWNEAEQETVGKIERFVRLMEDQGSGDRPGAVRCRKYAIWSEGLLRSMDELEQSCYAAKKYAGRIKAPSVDEMSAEQRRDYDRHVYFDKNAYIRIFSILDKLGMLLNEMLDLQTEKIKARFSFFTMLRRMRSRTDCAELSERMNALKEKHQGALNRLRRRRNMEIHHMNAELQDDLLHVLQPGAGAAHLENIGANMGDLDEGWEMVCRTLDLSFRELLKRGRISGGRG
ncbi:Cthe_2314 family HEPN domain-containing protein [Cohnella zeiphila]|uniref:Cthe-2314-like HEPN domain-containing protein n=1 Tax=Cohnella zeiphila TaxID=2761120 RepID=A0A7X0VU84_9BACL|nr:Cthe_2314 family HEPN domain-containing protein [Cohnella zeiphila]MBB6730749.1 hypothetical protein [Cohnella zeiphila]